MKIYYLLILLFFSSSLAFGQINAEKGYYITNTGEKIDCLIENEGWTNNPTSFDYKLNANAKTETLSINDVKEFGIYDKAKFIRKSVLIDKSLDNAKRLSRTRELDLVEERTFLKVIVDGEASLYGFSDSQLTRFFYNLNDGEIILLEYKKYIVNNKEIKTNADYRNQLYDALKCDNITIKNIRSIEYKSNNLISLFQTYNECQNTESALYFTEKKGTFLLGLQPAVSNISFLIDFGISGEGASANLFDANFEDQLIFKFGIDLEYIFPFNQSKWSAFLSPAYQKYSSESDIEDRELLSDTGSGVIIEYTSIELPLGIRHHMYLNDNSKLFLEAGIVLDMPVGDSYIEYEGRRGRLEIESNLNPTIGFGFRYKDKYGLLCRYQLNRNILPNYSAFLAKYSSLSLAVTYNIFSSKS